jgi:hypothetical protein
VLTVDKRSPYNCGRISSSTSNSYTYRQSQIKEVTITPADFWYNVSQWVVDFKFSGLLASNVTKIKVQAFDCQNRENSTSPVQDIKTI